MHRIKDGLITTSCSSYNPENPASTNGGVWFSQKEIVNRPSATLELGLEVEILEEENFLRMINLRPVIADTLDPRSPDQRRGALFGRSRLKTEMTS